MTTAFCRSIIDDGSGVLPAAVTSGHISRDFVLAALGACCADTHGDEENRAFSRAVGQQSAGRLCHYLTPRTYAAQGLLNCANTAARPLGCTVYQMAAPLASTPIHLMLVVAESQSNSRVLQGFNWLRGLIGQSELAAKICLQPRQGAIPGHFAPW